MKTNRGESIRAGRRNFDDADKAVDRWDVYEKHPKQEVTINSLKSNEILRVVPLGGLSGIGEKNMMVIEYADEAIVVDCGFDLSIDLPGVNFGIPVTQYLDSIKHKLKAYVLTHGHMDHTGALPYIVHSIQPQSSAEASLQKAWLKSNSKTLTKIVVLTLCQKWLL